MRVRDALLRGLLPLAAGSALYLFGRRAIPAEVGGWLPDLLWAYGFAQLVGSLWESGSRAGLGWAMSVPVLGLAHEAAQATHRLDGTGCPFDAAAYLCVGGATLLSYYRNHPPCAPRTSAISSPP